MSAIFMRKRVSDLHQGLESHQPNRSLIRQGFTMSRSILLGNWIVQTFDNPRGRSNLHFHEAGRFTVIALGPIWHGQRFGSDALRALTDNLFALGPLASVSTTVYQSLSGSFALVASDGQTVHVMTDRLGAIKFYRDESLQTLSTSFLSVAEAQRRLNINPQAAREYVLIEASHSVDSVIREVCSLSAGTVIDLDGSVERPIWRAIREGGFPRYRRLEDAIDDIESDLIAHFQRIASAYSNAAVALSGGFDSRLVYALCRRVNLPTNLFVYGSADSSDVSIAKMIAGGEGDEIIIVDKHANLQRYQPLTLSTFHESIDFFDGTPIDGAWDCGVDRATRIDQSGYGEVVLNGGGGEIFRNFFHLSARPHSFNEICMAFYSQFPRSAFPAQSDRREFYMKLQESMAKSIAFAGRHPTRVDNELVYPLFRCGWWMSRNNSVANRLGPFMTPLLTPELVSKAAGISIEWKNSGRFQAALINRISPGLARYPSSYGFAFANGPALKSRLNELVDLFRLPVVRPLISEIGRSWRAMHRVTEDQLKPMWSDFECVDHLSKLIRRQALFAQGAQARYETLKEFLARTPIVSD